MNTVTLSIRIDEDMKKQIEKLAKQDERSINFVVRKALEESLQNHAPASK